jgi:hypothetical protein
MINAFTKNKNRFLQLVMNKKMDSKGEALKIIP